MSGFEGLGFIIEEMDGIRDMLLVSGFYSIQENMIHKIKELANSANRCGLEQGGLLLEKIAKGLEAKRHALDYDFKELTNDFFKLNLYVEAIKKKMELMSIQESLMEKN